jgi:hypothetical protein
VTERLDDSPARAGHARPHPEAPATRPALTTRGDEVSYAELRFAAEVSRFPARFGIRVPVNGFLVWRAYTLLRAIWRIGRRVRRR